MVVVVWNVDTARDDARSRRLCPFEGALKTPPPTTGGVS